MSSHGSAFYNLYFIPFLFFHFSCKTSYFINNNKKENEKKKKENKKKNETKLSA